MRIGIFGIQLLLLLLAGMNTVMAQTSGALQRKIARLEAMGRYVEAAQLHIRLHDNGERDASIRAAMSLYRSARYQEAVEYFAHADSIGTLDQEDEVYGYFECLKAMKKYPDADRLIRTHMPRLPENVSLILHSEKERSYGKWMAYRRSIVKGMAMNSVYSDFGPALLDGFVYFESTRPDARNGKNSTSYFNLFAHPVGDTLKTIVQPKGSFGKPAERISAGGRSALSIPADINKDHNEGPLFISADGRYLFYTTNWHHDGKPSYKNPYLNLDYTHQALENSQKLEVGKIPLNIYYSIREGEVWSVPVPFPYNDRQWSNQHACFDPVTGTLYFSSNRPGGIGGFDLWKSVLNGTTWSEPENLGPHINTSRNEVFPALTPQGHLVFSSNGWPGLGGLDAFLAGLPGKDPLNMLAGINSEMDDFGLVFTGLGAGFMVSNRKESVGEDDIFEFETDVADIIDYHFPARTIMLVNSVTGEPLSGMVTIEASDSIRSIRIGKEGTLVKLSEQDAPVEVAIEGYGKFRSTLSALLAEDRICRIPLQPLPSPAVVNPNRIYFDYDKATITKDAAVVLNRLARTLNANPGMVIQASTHYGCPAPSAKNKMLVERRLKATLEYLQGRIINPGRVSVSVVDESGSEGTCDCGYHGSAHCEDRDCDNALPYVWYGLVKQYIRTGK